MGENANTLELQNSDFEEDRYSRLRLIPWWDQDRLKNATIMVVGAGAIGNELIKNLTLLGVGRILIYDMDAIESTNLKLVGPHHCDITLDGSKYVLTDCGTPMGTIVNGQKVARHILRQGDAIAIGNSVLVFNTK